MARGLHGNGQILGRIAGKGGGGKRGFQQHRGGDALHTGGHPGAHSFGGSRHAVAAGCFFLLGKLIGKIGSRGAAAARIGKHMNLQKADLLHKGHALQKVLLGFAGKAHDHIGGKADQARRKGSAQVLYHPGILLGGVGAAHTAQGGRAAALQAQVKLGAKPGKPCQPLNIAGLQHIGVKAAKAHTLNAGHCVDLFQNIQKARAVVLAVAGQADARNHHFFITGSGQSVQLGQNAGFVAAAHGAAGTRDHAIGTAAVAAVLDLDKGAGVILKFFQWQLFKLFALGVGLNIHHTRLGAVQHLGHISQNAVSAAGAGYHIGLGNGSGFLGEGLRIAARKHRNGAGVFPLGAAQPLAAFLIAEIGYGAAVDHIHIGAFAGGGQQIAVLLKQALQRAGFVLIHLAAKGIKTYTHEGFSCL